MALRVGEKRQSRWQKGKDWLEKHDDSRDHEVGELMVSQDLCRKVRPHTNITGEGLINDYLQQVGRVKRHQQEMAQYPWQSKNWEPLPLWIEGKKERTWGDSCMEGLPDRNAGNPQGPEGGGA